MDNLSLAALLDEDREMVLANLARDKALPAAQATMEKAVDRVMYRYVEACGDETLRRGAQDILQAMKNTLPLMDAVGQAQTWKRQAETPGKGGLNLGALTLVLLLAGLALVLASVVGVLIAGQLVGALAFVKALLPAALGCGALFWAGARASRPPKKRSGDGVEDVRTEYLVDGEKAYHCLRGAMLQADGQLERLRAEHAAAEQHNGGAAPAGNLDARALELFAELLESANAAGDANARESASAIRFYLHGAGVDAMDYEPGREGWFEFLPAAKPGTMRPALVSEGRLLKKGLASK